MKFYKGDEVEQKFDAAFQPPLSAIDAQRDLFFDDAYACAVLGDILWEAKLAPLTNAIPQSVFRDTFSAVFETFLQAGSLEAYIVVFKKIFGDDVEVTFTIPAPGHLQIDIVAETVVLSDLVARHITSNQYVFDEIIDYDGDNIAVQTIKGFQSQYELEQMLFEMVPGGIYTEITLTLGA